MKSIFKHFTIILLMFPFFKIEAQVTNTNKVLIPYRDKNLYGLADTLGNIKVKPIYKDIKDFIVGYNSNYKSRYVVKSNKSYYVIDNNRKILLPEINTYDSIRLNKYEPNYFWVYKKGKVGLFHNNKEIINCFYDRISVTHNQSYEVQKGKLVGLLNSVGKLIIPIEYVNIRRSWDDEDEKNPKFVWIAEGMLVEKKFYDTKIATKEEEGEMIGVKEMAMDSSNGEDDDAKFNRIQKILEQRYDNVRLDEYNYIAYVKKENKSGIVNINNESNLKEIISPIYESIEYYGWDKNVKVYKVTLNGKFGLVKPENNVLLNCEFDQITKDHILVKDNKKGMIIFNTIYPYIKPKYNSIKSIDGIQVNNNWQFGLFEVTTEKGKGLVGENGVEFFKD